MRNTRTPTNLLHLYALEFESWWFSQFSDYQINYLDVNVTHLIARTCALIIQKQHIRCVN